MAVQVAFLQLAEEETEWWLLDELHLVAKSSALLDDLHFHNLYWKFLVVGLVVVSMEAYS